MRRGDRGVVLGLYRSGHDRGLLEGALSLGVRALDTAYNYLGFTSHRSLAATASDLLGEFTISTKVGFFPSDHGAEHCLDPARLRHAVDASVANLGVAPAVMLLHNPERTLAELAPEPARDHLVAACAVLDEAVTAGLCGAWGISCWDTRPLLRVLHATAGSAIATPGVLMIRAGLLVPTDVLTASEQVAGWFDLDTSARWGMSPFRGDATNPVWDTVNLRLFLTPGQQCTTLGAAFRAAYELPRVSRIATGTSSVDHLRELLDATTLDVADDQIARYRTLLRATAVRGGAR